MGSGFRVWKYIVFDSRGRIQSEFGIAVGRRGSRKKAADRPVLANALDDQSVEILAVGITLDDLIIEFELTVMKKSGQCTINFRVL